MLLDSPENWKASSHEIKGTSLNAGIGLGRVVLHTPAPFKRIPKKLDSVGELNCLNDALSRLTEEVQSLVTRQQYPREAQDLLDVYLALANDPSWKRQLRERVQSGEGAFHAVDQTLQVIRGKLEEQGAHSLWQTRIHDFEDLSRRLKRHLSGIPSLAKEQLVKGKKGIVVIAEHISPAELLEYDRRRLVGLILEEKSQTSHVAIMARSLAIPVVGGIKDIINQVSPGDPILIDGNKGHIYIRPVAQIIRHFKTASFSKQKQVGREATSSLPAETRDGVLISLQLNAGLVEDVGHIEAAGAQGIGLYRTEIPFMMLPKLPNVAEQTAIYREILAQVGNYPVVFRTLDVSGDKILPYLERLKSKNPIMGWRAIRVFLDRPILLRYQLKALIRACVGRDLMLMLPMIAEVSELKTARNLLDSEIERERTKGNPLPTTIRLGVMLETPSIVYQLPHLIPHVDFLSVGSNDLFQFFYAIDRGNPGLPDHYDVLSPTFLSLLKDIQNRCQAAQIPLSLCGEMAGRSLEALALIGLGYRTLSMSAAALPTIRQMIRTLNCQEITDYMTAVCIPAQGNIRQSLKHFARDHGILCE